MKHVFILQLDGVSSQVLDLAIARGLMPTTKKLLRRGWVKRPFFSGLPSTTPASQMALLYGINDLVVGFQFALKKKHMIFVPYNHATLTAIESMAAAKNPDPLVRHGATIFSLFSGQAAKSISIGGIATNSKNIFPVIRFFLSPVRSVLFVLKLLVYLAIEQKEHSSQTHMKTPRGGRVFHILKRMVEEIIDGEMSYYLSRKMIRDGMPVIYVDFSGYDEIAHLYGPDHSFAMHYLSMLDTYIRGISRKLGQGTTSYELVILSDHGHAHNTSYAQYCGESLQGAVKRLYPAANLADHPTSFAYEGNSDSDLLYLDSGNFTLVYDKRTGQSPTRIQFEKRYPGFFADVSRFTGVECVIGREKKDLIFYVNGSPASGATLFPTLTPSERTSTMRSLNILMGAPYAPDVLIVGKIEKDFCVALTDTQGAHGGIGDTQTSSFCMSRDFTFEQKDIRDFADLHRKLDSYIHSDQRATN